jgi:hypothetical protein
VSQQSVSSRFTPVEANALYLLVGQAWELKESGSPYFIDACRAIIDWHERRPLARLESKEEDIGRLVQLLRETNPEAA